MKEINGVEWFRVLCNHDDCERHGIGDYGYCERHKKDKYLRNKCNKNGVRVSR